MPDHATEVLILVGDRRWALFEEESGQLLSAGEGIEFRWPAKLPTRGLAIRLERAASRVGAGVQVQVHDGTAWSTARIIHPRATLDTYGIGGFAGDRVRFITDQPTRIHSVSRLRWDASAGPATAISMLAPSQVDGVETLSTLSEEDGEGLRLSMDDPAGARFSAPETPEGTVRNFFLAVTGGYQAGMSNANAGLARLEPADLPREFALGPALPNPSSGHISFAVDLPREAQLRLEILDAQGRLVRVLADESRQAGRYRLQWDGRSNAGRKASTGIYYARLRAPGFVTSRSVVLIP